MVSAAEEPAIRLQLATLQLNENTSKALENATMALAGAKKYKDNNTRIEALHLVGEIYQQQNDPKNALKHYEEELDLREKQPANEQLAKLNYTIAALYRAQNKPRRATDYLEKSLSIAKKLNLKPLIQENYEALFTTFYDLGNYKEAMKYFKISIQIRDSLLQVNNTKVISKIVSQHKTENQEKEIKIEELNDLKDKQQLEIKNQQFEIENQQLEIKNKELAIERKNIERNYLIAILGFISLVIILLFSLYSSKRKANIRLAGQNYEIQEQKEEIEAQRDEISSQLCQLELLNRELMQQKEEIITQRDEIEEKSTIIEQKNSDITKSIEYALLIQQAILPTMEEIETIFPDSFVLYKPKDIVSGDFYWMASVPGNRTFIAAVDCTGHGVPGGFMSMIGMEKLNDIVSRSGDIKNLHPAQILNQLDNEIKKAFRQATTDSLSDGMDIALCEFDFNSGNVWYAGANRPLWIIKNSNGEVIEYQPIKKGIGDIYEEDVEYKNIQPDISPGDMIYFFSDGYEDQFGGDRKRKLMKKNLKALFASVHKLPAPKQYEYLDTYFNTWKKGESQVDDLLVVGIRHIGATNACT